VPESYGWCQCLVVVTVTVTLPAETMLDVWWRFKIQIQAPNLPKCKASVRRIFLKSSFVIARLLWPSYQSSKVQWIVYPILVVRRGKVQRNSSYQQWCVGWVNHESTLQSIKIFTHFSCMCKRTRKQVSVTIIQTTDTTMFEDNKENQSMRLKWSWSCAAWRATCKFESTMWRLMEYCSKIRISLTRFHIHF